MSDSSTRRHEEFQNINQFTNEAAISFLKYLALVNGGAAVAVLGFLASIATDSSPSLVADSSIGLESFAWGSMLAVCSLGMAYLTNYTLLIQINQSGGDWARFFQRLKAVVHLFTVAVSLSPIYFFFLGVRQIVEAFSVASSG